MMTITRPFTELTARELMTPEPMVIPKHMSLRAAAHLLSQAQVSGAPVVDDRGSLIGVISATDYVRYTEGQRGRECCTAHAHACMCSDWRMMELEKLPVEEVAEYMTSDPVTVLPHSSITELARTMMEAHIHRVIVIDAARRPVGVVSTTDILAAVAYAELPT